MNKIYIDLSPNWCHIGAMKGTDFERPGAGGIRKLAGAVDYVRSIRMPKAVWDALDRDAERCKRSSVKQLEALLTVLYGLGDVEINKEELEKLSRTEGLRMTNKVAVTEPAGK